jgi:two-component SAPR family response regulator
MTSVCYVSNIEVARIIEGSSQYFDPRGQFSFVDSFDELRALIGVLKPDVVWLDASPDNFAYAADSDTVPAGINWIFISDDMHNAAEAFRVHASGFILEPVEEGKVIAELQNLRYPVQPSKNLRIQCFGNFEAMSDGVAIRFSRSLGKEALAYLVDRRGAACTINEICNTLWENRVVDKNLKSQCRMIMSSLKRDLDAVDAADILVKQWNTWAVNVEKLSCDYYDFLEGDKKERDRFRGEYMAQYSWAEMTSGSLYQLQK